MVAATIFLVASIFTFMCVIFVPFLAPPRRLYVTPEELAERVLWGNFGGLFYCSLPLGILVSVALILRLRYMRANAPTGARLPTYMLKSLVILGLSVFLCCAFSYRPLLSFDVRGNNFNPLSANEIYYRQHNIPARLVLIASIWTSVGVFYVAWRTLRELQRRYGASTLQEKPKRFLKQSEPDDN